MIKLRLKQS